MQDRETVGTSPLLSWVGVAIGIVFPTIVTLTYFVFGADDDPAAQQTRYAVMKCLQFALPVVWVAVVLREAIPRNFVPSRNGWSLGLAFGGVVLLAMVGLYAFALRDTSLFLSASEGVREKLAGMGVDTLPEYVILGVFYSLLHSLLEEYYWRWFVFGQLRRVARLWPAILISSVGFAAHHVIVLAAYFGWLSWATWLFSLAIVVGGGVWAWLYERSGSIGAPWLSHLLIDAAIFLIGYDLGRPLWT